MYAIPLIVNDILVYLYNTYKEISYDFVQYLTKAPPICLTFFITII